MSKSLRIINSKSGRNNTSPMYAVVTTWNNEEVEYGDFEISVMREIIADHSGINLVSIRYAGFDIDTWQAIKAICSSLNIELVNVAG